MRYVILFSVVFFFYMFVLNGKKLKQIFFQCMNKLLFIFSVKGKRKKKHVHCFGRYNGLKWFCFPWCIGHKLHPSYSRLYFLVRVEEMQVESKKGKTRFTKTVLPACD